MRNMETFFDTVSENLKKSHVSFVNGRKTSSLCETDYLFFRVGERGSKRRRPVAVCICHEAGPTEQRIARFFDRPARTKFGEPLRLALVVTNKTTADEVADGLQELLTVEDEHLPASLQWLIEHRSCGAWTELPLPERQEAPSSELTANYAPTDVGRRAPKERPPAGIIFENALAEALRDFGFTVVRNEFLDDVAKTDFVLTSCNGIRRFRKLAVQVTQRWDDLLKMRTYHRFSTDAIRGIHGTQRLYVQYASSLTPREVAAAILGHAVSAVGKDIATSAAYLEVDELGSRLFDVRHRLVELRQMADPVRTAKQRMKGRIRRVQGGFISIVGAPDAEGNQEWFAAHLGDVADPELRRRLRAHIDGVENILGTLVSFIPAPPNLNRSTRRTTKSILLATPTGTILRAS